MEAAPAVAADAVKKEASGPFASRMEALSVKVKNCVEVLQDIQKQHDELEAKFNAEKAALIAKYDKLYEPLYSKRADIVNGVTEVEGVAAKAPAAEPPAGEEKEEKGVPEFWLTAMKTNEIVASEITERDEGALKYLKDIKSVNLDELKGFRLEFYFHPNPYFKNEVLTKSYQMVDENDILEHATGTVIDWLPGKNLTQKLMKKKPKKGTKSAGPPVTKIEECDSFFNFFSPPQIPENDEDMDEEEAEELQDIMEQDYDVGTAIKDKIIPHAVSWYTGEAVEGEEYEDDTEEDEDENEDEEDEEDEDDEDDEDEGSNPKLVKKGSKQKEAGQPPECKQQ